MLVRKQGSNDDETTAEILMRMLISDDGTDHVSYAASWNEALDLVKVRKQRKNVKNATEQDVDSMPGDAKSFVKSVINVPQLKEGSTLITIVWVSKIARHYHLLHPQVLGVDTKKKVNAKKCLDSLVWTWKDTILLMRRASISLSKDE